MATPQGEKLLLGKRSERQTPAELSAGKQKSNEAQPRSFRNLRLSHYKKRYFRFTGEHCCALRATRSSGVTGAECTLL